jgi:hypothetical protein
MKLISHRGNISGKQPGLENMPEYVLDTLKKGYDVEIDVWYNNGFWLGHDEPTFPIGVSFLKNKKLWCHAKNPEALSMMRKENDIHYFWHQNDDYTITSQKYIWTYPNKLLYCDSICVLPELGHAENIKDCYGICSDYIEKWK